MAITAIDNRSQIRLFAFPTSPYAMKVGCYLAYKQLDYEFVGVNPVNFNEIRFTGKKQVPVLQVGEDWKLESSIIGEWLDELYPERRLLGANDSEKTLILAQDEWVSKQLIPALFRILVDWPSIPAGLRNGWKLTAAVNDATPIPAWVRLLWPILVKKAKFIVSMVDELNRKEPISVLQQRLISDFIDRLDGGPFLGGMKQPSLADLSAFPIIVFAYRFGLEGDAEWFSDERIVEWCNLVQQHLPSNPFLVESSRLVCNLPSSTSRMY